MWNIRRIILCCYLLRFSEEILQLHAFNDPYYNGHYHIANAVEQTIVRSLLDCASLCLHSTRCLSYFYNTQSKECILHEIAFGNNLPSYANADWKYYLTVDRSTRCPPMDNFVYYRRLHLCYNINGPIRTDFNVFNSTCQSFGAELIRIDSEEKQRYIVKATSNRSTGHVCMQGTNTKDPTGSWTFDDGTVMSYFNWNTNKRIQREGTNLGMDINNGATWSKLKKQMGGDCIFLCERR